jgi:hypothetical protein
LLARCNAPLQLFIGLVLNQRIRPVVEVVLVVVLVWSIGIASESHPPPLDASSMSSPCERDDTPTLEQPRVKRARTLSPVPRQRDELLMLTSSRGVPLDHTLNLAHAVFMQIFDLLPTRQLLSLAFVSRHWRRMQLSFFRSSVRPHTQPFCAFFFSLLFFFFFFFFPFQLGVIDLTDIVREQPAECEWPLVAAALDKALSTKQLKPSYRERLAPIPVSTPTTVFLSVFISHTYICRVVRGCCIVCSSPTPL